MQSKSGEMSEPSGGKSCWRYVKYVMLAGTLIMGGCGNGIVPVDATLTITPGTHTTRITERQNESGRCLFDANHHVDIPILLQLTTVDGSPIGDAELNVYVDFAENTYSGLTTLELYDDLNSNGVVDAPLEYISGFNNDIARVKTGQWSGSRMLLLRINLSCSFRGEVFAYTGGTSGRAEIEVLADEVVQPEVMLTDDEET